MTITWTTLFVKGFVMAPRRFIFLPPEGTAFTSEVIQALLVIQYVRW